ncbi:MAG: 50S ribosomal protein L29 [Bryobacteraceae bacterium]|jgi:large subunit ribosomal protein L29|nr:50S ribosomal protein L29 [Bryobacteraceae bacterium]
MKTDQIRAMDEKELAVKAREIDDQIFRLRFQMSLGQTDGLKKYRELRKDRARLMTILRERELTAAKGAN